MYYVFHWNRWFFGGWEIAFHGSKSECEKWASAHPGNWVVSQEKPSYRLEVGTGADGYNNY